MNPKIRISLMAIAVALFSVILSVSPQAQYSNGRIADLTLSLLDGQKVDVQGVEVQVNPRNPDKVRITIQGLATGSQLDLSLVDLTNTIPTKIESPEAKAQPWSDGSFLGALEVFRTTLSPRTCLLVRSYKDGKLGVCRYVPIQSLSRLGD